VIGVQLAYIVVVCVTIAINAAVAAADYARAEFVLANSAQVHVPDSWLQTLATLKLAGAVGLLIGLLGVRPLGIAAAAGLVVFFAGAVTTHVRARVYYNLAFPGWFLAMAAASLVLFVSH
jgi:DoxX-like family